MRVGFITQLLWNRYGAFWTSCVQAIGGEVVLPGAERTWRYLSDPRSEGLLTGAAFRLAVAQALALDADVLIAPELNPGQSATRGGGQDAFITDFPQALARSVPGLPPVIGVPASLEGPGLEPIVVARLLELCRDPVLVRRVWERQRASAKVPQLAEPKWRVLPSGGEGTLGVVGQPWLLTDNLVQKALKGRHGVSQEAISRQKRLDEGRRLHLSLLETDLEVLGAARFFSRKGQISKLLVLADELALPDAFLLDQIMGLTRKDVEVAYLSSLGGVNGA